MSSLKCWSMCYLWRERFCCEKTDIFRNVQKWRKKSKNFGKLVKTKKNKSSDFLSSLPNINKILFEFALMIISHIHTHDADLIVTKTRFHLIKNIQTNRFDYVKIDWITICDTIRIMNLSRWIWIQIYQLSICSLH
jgi:hypothetical protein